MSGSPEGLEVAQEGMLNTLKEAVVRFDIDNMTALKLTDRRLKGKVIAFEKTGQTVTREGETWEKCIFTLKVTRFSKRTPEEVVPDHLKGKKIKLVRHCIYDWHYTLGVEKTLNPGETDSLLQGKQTATIFW